MNSKLSASGDAALFSRFLVMQIPTFIHVDQEGQVRVLNNIMTAEDLVDIIEKKLYTKYQPRLRLLSPFSTV